MKAARRGWKSWNAIVLGFVMMGGFFNTGWSDDLPAPTTAGAPATGTSTALEQRVDQLEHQIQTLQQQVQSNSPAANPTPPPDQSSNPPAGEVTAGRAGFAIQSGDGNFLLRFMGLIQVDGRFLTGSGDNRESYTSAVNSSGQAPGVSEFLLRRVRPAFSGTLYHMYDFLLQPDFGGNAAIIVDAYVDAKPEPYANVRIGKFKTPLGIEHLQTDSYVMFTERGMTSDLAPHRDTGAGLYGGFWSDTLTYQASITNGIADGATTPDSDTNNSKDGTLRVFAKPFKSMNASPWEKLGFGMAGSYSGDISDIPTYKTSASQQQFFSYDSTTHFNGQRIHLIPQANYYLGPLGVYGEYAETNQVAQVGVIRKNLHNDAWQGVVSWVLTGEDASFTGITPAKPFDLKARTWGAWELAARFQQLQIDPDTFKYGFSSLETSATRATSYTLGTNWYLDKFVKLVMDYEQTWFENGNGPHGNRPIERVIGTRCQLAF